MKKSRFRPVMILALMLLLTSGNVVRLSDKHPVSAIMAVSLVAMGMLLGAMIYALVRIVREKNADVK